MRDIETPVDRVPFICLAGRLECARRIDRFVRHYYLIYLVCPRDAAFSFLSFRRETSKAVPAKRATYFDVQTRPVQTARESIDARTPAHRLDGD